MRSLLAAALLASLAGPAWVRAAAPSGVEVRFLDSLDIGLNVSNPKFTVGRYAGKTCAFYQHDSNLVYTFLGDQDGPHVLAALNGDLRSIRASDVWLAYATANRTVAVLDLSGILDAAYDSTFTDVNSRDLFIHGNTLYVAQRNAGLGIITNLATTPEYRLHPLGGEVANVFGFQDWLVFTMGQEFGTTFVGSLNGARVDTLDTLEVYHGNVPDMELKGDTLFTAVAWHINYDIPWWSIGAYSLRNMPDAKQLAFGSVSPLAIEGIAVGDSVILIAASDGIYSVARDFSERSDTALTLHPLFKTHGKVIGDVSVVGDTLIVAERTGPGEALRYYLGLYKLERPLATVKPAPRRQAAQRRQGDMRLINGRAPAPNRRPPSGQILRLY